MPKYPISIYHNDTWTIWAKMRVHVTCSSCAETKKASHSVPSTSLWECYNADPPQHVKRLQAGSFGRRTAACEYQSHIYLQLWPRPVPRRLWSRRVGERSATALTDETFADNGERTAFATFYWRSMRSIRQGYKL